MESYKILLEKEQEASLINSISSVLSWDRECVMPPWGAPYRADQFAYLARLKHTKDTSSELGELLKNLEEKKESLTEEQQRVLELAQRNFEVKQRTPGEFVGTLAKETSLGQSVWQEAYKKNDFNLFKPQLKKIIDLTKQQAKYLNPKSDNLYDNLLSQFDWGFNGKLLDQIFSEIKDKIPHLVQQVKQQGKFKNHLGRVVVSREKQERINQVCLDLMGMNPNKTKLSKSTHPFSTTLGPNDYRITTRYNENDLTSSYLGVAHEMGHSLYEQGLPEKYKTVKVGQACSYGVHESQSLFWEKKIASSKAFLELLWPTITKEVPEIKEKCDLDGFYYSLNQVKNSLIRVDSDEVTYILHIIIRYEIEQALINEDLSVDEVQNLWNLKYQEYLGLSPVDDRTSCLQDVHWSCGAFGYFPSYALGHLISSQVEKTLESDLMPLDQLIRENKIAAITKWLKENVHEKGNLYDPRELIKKVTKNEISTRFFVDYIENKYLES